MEKYGLIWPKDTFNHEGLIEVALYGHDSLRKKCPDVLPKEDHLHNAIDLLFPKGVFVHHKDSRRIIEAWCNTNALTLWGPSSCGKSATIGMIMLIDLMVSPAETLVRCITTPLSEHYNRAYGAFLMWYKHLPEDMRPWTPRKQPMGLFTTTDTKNAGVTCFSSQRGDTLDDLKRRIGAHAQRNRIVVDEAQGCSDAVLALRINLGASGEYKEVFLGNPDSKASPLGKHSFPKRLTWSQIEKEEPYEWETRNTVGGIAGKCLVIDGRDCPSLTEPEKYPFLLQPAHVREITEIYGEDSLLYWTFVRGRLPPGGLKNVLMPDVDIEEKGCLDTVVWDSAPEAYACGDFAPQGTDNNVLYLIRTGRAITGKFVIQLEERRYLYVDVTKPDKSQQIAEQVVQWLRNWDVPIDRFAMDVSGNQGPLADTIERTYGSFGIYRVSSEGGASKRVITHGIMAKERYANKATEIAFNVELLMRHGQVKGVDDEIVKQMSTRELTDRGRGLQVEPKEEWRLRNKQQSPDEFDALACGCTMLLERGLITLDGQRALTAPKNATWESWKKRDVRQRRTRMQRLTA